MSIDREIADDTESWFQIVARQQAFKGALGIREMGVTGGGILFTLYRQLLGNESELANQGLVCCETLLALQAL